jgi:hypothetical protein
MWFTLTILLAIATSIFVILIRREYREEMNRKDSGEFSADDFEIIEGDK